MFQMIDVRGEFEKLQHHGEVVETLVRLTPVSEADSAWLE